METNPIIAKQFKVHKELTPGLFSAWPTVCKVKKDGVFVDYRDLEGDVVDESAVIDMVKSTAGQICKIQFTHNDGMRTVGHIVEKFALTEDIQKDLGIEAEYTGMICHIQAVDEEAAERMRGGCMLSIGGTALEYEEID